MAMRFETVKSSVTLSVENQKIDKRYHMDGIHIEGKYIYQIISTEF